MLIEIYLAAQEVTRVACGEFGVTSETDRAIFRKLLARVGRCLEATDVDTAYDRLSDATATLRLSRPLADHPADVKACTETVARIARQLEAATESSPTRLCSPRPF